MIDIIIRVFMFTVLLIVAAIITTTLTEIRQNIKNQKNY